MDPISLTGDSFVLLVDDNPETLNLFALALGLEGIEVRTANSVKRALEVLYDGSRRPALIITDLLMPQTTRLGFSQASPGRALAESQLPIIVITGVEPGESEQLADTVLQKPIDPLQLAEMVRARLRPASPAPRPDHPSPSLARAPCPARSGGRAFDGQPAKGWRTIRRVASPCL